MSGTEELGGGGYWGTRRSQTSAEEAMRFGGLLKAVCLCWCVQGWTVPPGPICLDASYWEDWDPGAATRQTV